MNLQEEISRIKGMMGILSEGIVLPPNLRTVKLHLYPDYNDREPNFITKIILNAQMIDGNIVMDVKETGFPGAETMRIKKLTFTCDSPKELYYEADLQSKDTTPLGDRMYNDDLTSFLNDNFCIPNA